MKRGRQGILFRIRLGSCWLSLWFLGVLPLGLIRLSSITHIQNAERGDFFRGGVRRWLMPWGYWLWPASPGNQPHVGVYLLVTRRGSHVWMRLRSGLHYQLREFVHRAKTGLV